MPSNLKRRLQLSVFLLATVTAFTFFTACDEDPLSEENAADVVEVVSTGTNFNLPDNIPSGWTTFRFKNESNMTHFFILEKLPLVNGEQKTVKDSKAEVVPAFQAIMDAIIAGEKLPLGMLPEWYPLVKFVGGPGFVAPGRTAETTIFVKPGTYAIECYVKMKDGTFHSSMGMIEGLVVTEATTGEAPPESTMEVTISSTQGITISGNPTQGKQTIKVRFEDQAVYSHFLGHDVHLARLENDTDMNALAAWMNWSAPKGLTTPGVPAVFVGGAQDMPDGSVAYITVDLKPGRYAWISEVPNPAEKGMLKTFTVSTDN